MSSSQTAASKSILNFIKGGNLQPESKPGFSHALKLSYNLIAKDLLSFEDKTLSYRYRTNQHVPKLTTGLLTALMDELSTNACFGAGMPCPPGVSLQMQTDLLAPVEKCQTIDIHNVVTKLGRTVSHTRTDYVCAETNQVLACSSHVKYMPTGNFVLDFIFTNRWAYTLYEWIVLNRSSPAMYEEVPLAQVVGAPHLEFVNEGVAKFHITRKHTNPFGAMHGGCHAMIMERVGQVYSKAQLNSDQIHLEGIQINFLRAAKGESVDVLCETIGIQNTDRILVQVLIQKEGRTLSEGKLRFVATE